MFFILIVPWRSFNPAWNPAPLCLEYLYRTCMVSAGWLVGCLFISLWFGHRDEAWAFGVRIHRFGGV
jgi:hypothetical protein